MSFESQKAKQLAKSDKSHVGTWDKRIIPLCNKINKNKDYYTTSSCSGRIILIKSSIKKQPNLFIFRMHDRITFKQLKHELKKAEKSKTAVFKQEPAILHVACRNLESAQLLVDKAKFCGWKRSGIMATRKRIICELMSTEHIELPIVDKGKIVVSDNYLKILVREADKKLERTWVKISSLEKLFNEQ